MDKDDLLKLYETVVQEEHYFIEAHQDRVAFYSGLVTAIVAGIGAGVLESSEWYHFAALCFGPLLLIAVANNAISGSYRLYQRFLESVTVRAKIEQELGLTRQHSDTTDATDLYWFSEPLIPPRHIEGRKAYESSAAFIRGHSGRGYHQISTRLFRGTQLLSIPMLVGLAYLAFSKAP